MPSPGRASARALAGLPGGLTRAIFQARTQVLGGEITGEAVRPFLSSLLIESEIRVRPRPVRTDRTVHLVAGPPQLDLYAEILARSGFTLETYDPESTTVAGLTRLASAAGLLQPALG